MAKKKKSAKKRGGFKKAARRFFRSTFFKVYIAVVVLFIVAVFIGGGWLRGQLAEYEETLPVYVAEDFFKTFENRDFNALYAMDTNNQDIGGGDKAFYVETLTELSQGGSFTMKERYTTQADTKIYRVLLDGQPFAEFMLAPGEKKTASGFRYWEPVSVTSYVSAEKYDEQAQAEAVQNVVEVVNVTVAAPENYKVSVNGRELGAADAVETYSAYTAKDFLPKGVPETMMRRYSCELDTHEVDVRVTDAAGAEVALTQENEYSWYCLPPFDESLSTHEEAVKEIASALSMYTTHALKEAKMKGYCIGGSPAYNIIKEFNQRITLAHQSADFTDWQITNYRRHGDNCFTCHVHFTYTCHFAKAEDKVYDIAYTMCFGVKDNRVLLYNVDFN